MTNNFEELKQELIVHIKKYGIRWHTRLRDVPHLKKFLEDNKPENLKSNNISERAYWIIHDMTDYPICPHCGNKSTHYSTIFRGYTKYCSKECASVDSERIKKGVMSRSAETRRNQGEKIRNIWNSKSDEERSRILKKVRDTNKLLHGDPNWTNPEKRKQTCLESYGVEYPAQTERVMMKVRSTRYGNYYDKTFLNNDYLEPLFSKEEYVEIGLNGEHLTHEFMWRCKKCGNEFSSKLNGNWFTKGTGRCYARCLKCFPILNEYFHSIREMDCVEYVKTLVTSQVICGEDPLLKNLIPPYTIDMFIPNLNVAVEFNGLRWHCIDQVKRGYHLEKTRMCEEAGIRLIHIWEDEWDKKSEETRNKLKEMIFGVSEVKGDEVMLDRAWFSTTSVPYDYMVVEEIPPEIIIRTNVNGISYGVENCGWLKCRKI